MPSDAIGKGGQACIGLEERKERSKVIEIGRHVLG
jgi:hypothetical protein